MTTSKPIVWLTSLCILAIIVSATLVPVSFRPHLPLPADLERAIAFAALGCSLATAKGKNFFVIAVAIIVIAGGLEWLQTLSETRHGQIHDFYVKAAGALIGIALAGGWRALTIRDRSEMSL